MTLSETVLVKDLIFFIKGTIVGFAISAPIGPASILCIKRTLNKGFFLGLATGLGVAIADTIYGFITGFGLTGLADWMIGWFTRTQLLGAAFLILIGTLIYRRPVEKADPEDQNEHYPHAVFSGFGLTIVNPLILILFTALFAAVGIDDLANDFQLVFFVILGIFSGSMVWWFLLGSALSLLKQRLQVSSFGWTNKFSGGMIILLGFYALLTAF